MSSPSSSGSGRSRAAARSRPLLRLLPLLPLLPLAGSALADPTVLTYASAQTRLQLMAPEESVQALEQQRLPGLRDDDARELELRQYCSAGAAQRPTASKGFFEWLSSPVTRLAIAPLAAQVREELMRYSVVTSAGTTVDFYAGEPAGDNAHPVLQSRFRCLHFTRLSVDAAGSARISLDFVGAIGLDSARDAIALRPLRLFIERAAARSATGRYGVAIALRADAVWRDEFVGHRQTIFEETLVAENVDLRSGSVLRYYDANDTRTQRVPIVPISSGIDRTRDFGRADFTLFEAEVGPPPATLALLGELLPPPEGGIGALLIKAAQAVGGG